MSVEETYQKFLAIPSDIQNHLPILRAYAENSESIVELGFRGGVSTSALVAGKPKRLMIVDWDKEPYRINRERLDEIIQSGEEQGMTVTFTSADSLSVDIPLCDMMFLDTFHTYEHLYLELIKHTPKVSKYLLIHDTDEPICPGMFCAIEDFLMSNSYWRLADRYTDRPGLTVLERIVPCFDPSIESLNLRRNSELLYGLTSEVEHQKQLYYKTISEAGSVDNDWLDYVRDQIIRFQDKKRWPIANFVKPSATDLMLQFDK